MDVAEGDFIRQLMAVFLVFGLLGAAVWKLRGTSMNNTRLGSQPFTSIDRIALTPQHAVHLIRIGDREFAIATHPHGCLVLSDAATSSGRISA